MIFKLAFRIHSIFILTLALTIPTINLSAQTIDSVVLTNDAFLFPGILSDDTGLIIGAEIINSPPNGITTGLITGVLPEASPVSPGALIMSTGNPNRFFQPNQAGGDGDDYNGGNVRGDTDFDVTVVRLDIEVPTGANCLTGIDFAFYSEEYPEYVESAYNDAFIVELDTSTWTTSGSSISAPNNFAFDPSGATISINAVGVATMQPEFAAGTTFDGATPVLRAVTPITAGFHSLYLSIFDQGDRVLDSAVVVDNVSVGFVNNIETDCKPGVELVDEKNYVAIGDSYSSGFGVSPYAPALIKI